MCSVSCNPRMFWRIAVYYDHILYLNFNFELVTSHVSGERRYCVIGPVLSNVFNVGSVV